MIPADVLFPSIGAVLMGVIALKALSESEPAGFFALLLAAGFGWAAYDNTKPEVQARKAEEEAANARIEQAKATPHVIREADGCKVYAFWSDGRNHYFTRCQGSSVSTESSYSCGKNCTRTEVIGDGK